MTIDLEKAKMIKFIHKDLIERKIRIKMLIMKLINNKRTKMNR